jgi:Fic family protein
MKKSLIQTNPYLKNPADREQAMVLNITSSSAIEGIQMVRDTKSGLFISRTAFVSAANQSATTS